jgi:hypothetical protein
LTALALALGSGDNVTAVVVALDWVGQDAIVESLPLSVVASPPPSSVLPGASVWPSFSKAPLTLKSVQGETLQRSYFWLNESSKTFCIENLKPVLGFMPDLPCWMAQDVISCFLYKQEGLDLVRATEMYHGRYFLWAAELSNVHTTFRPSQLYSEIISVRGIVYPGGEHYFQSAKSYGTRDFETAFTKIMSDPSSDRAFSLGRIFEARV